MFVKKDAWRRLESRVHYLEKENSNLRAMIKDTLMNIFRHGMPTECDVCKGEGYVLSGTGMYRFTQTCTKCNGWGRVWEAQVPARKTVTTIKRI